MPAYTIVSSLRLSRYTGARLAFGYVPPYSALRPYRSAKKPKRTMPMAVPARVVKFMARKGLPYELQLGYTYWSAGPTTFVLKIQYDVVRNPDAATAHTLFRNLLCPSASMKSRTSCSFRVPCPASSAHVFAVYYLS